MVWCGDCLLTEQFNEKSVEDAMGRYNREKASEKEHSDQHTTPHFPDMGRGRDAVGPSNLDVTES